MIRIVIPQLDRTIECIRFEFESSRIEDELIGFGYIPSTISMTATFKERPEILHKILMGNLRIEEMIVYMSDDSSPTVFRYVVVDWEEAGDRNEFIIHMKALSISDSNTYFKHNRRLCECGTPIEYMFVNNLMSSNGIPVEAFESIWGNDLFRFRCCLCYKKQEIDSGRLPEHYYTGEYITIRWDDGLGRNFGISGA